MTEPTTVNLGLTIPNTGDLPGSWGTSAMNPNFSAIDGKFGGVATISLSIATTIALSASTASITPGAGPFQQFNRMLTFTGTQSGTATIQFSIPGDYVINNQCVGTTFPIVLAPASGTGTKIGVPFGKKTTVFFDGVNMDFVNLPDPGTSYDLHTSTTSLPVWMLACTSVPYLIKDGTVWSVSSFPALAAVLGSTFGGNGVTTFGVPDERNRMRIPIDTGTNGGFVNRVTAGGSGVNGTTMGATGGNELLQSHNHGLTDPGHTHVATPSAPNAINPSSGGYNGGNAGSISNPSLSVSISTSTTGITISSAGGGGSQNMPPTIVSFLALIKT